MEPSYNKAQIRAIIGLGNPGAKFYRNRHNIGFRAVDAIAAAYDAAWKETDAMSHATIRPEGIAYDIYLIKPKTYMNSSGLVMPWLTKKGIKPEEILVVHDELEKKFSRLVLKFGGSHKGHNGLRSLIGAVGPLFWRLKFGIDRPGEQEHVPNYVLADFTSEQELLVPDLLKKAVDLII